MCGDINKSVLSTFCNNGITRMIETSILSIKKLNQETNYRMITSRVSIVFFPILLIKLPVCLQLLVFECYLKCNVYIVHKWYQLWLADLFMSKKNFLLQNSKISPSITTYPFPLTKSPGVHAL